MSQTTIPNWTVLYNIVSPEDGRWVGTGWEFFDDEEDAEFCRRRHERLGNVPTKRPFHTNDIPHLGAAHTEPVMKAVQLRLLPAAGRPPKNVV